MTVDHALPPPDEWTCRKIAQGDYVHDWEAGRRHES